MDLVINKHLISASISEILEQLKIECNGRYLSYIGKEHGEDIKITCPFHKDGQERHPSAHIYCSSEDPKIYKGTFHCFTCGKKTPLYTVVAKCLDIDEISAQEWLVERFGDVLVEEDILFPDLDINTPIKSTTSYMDESILNKYNFVHPYTTKRKISPEVISRFKIGYDSELDMITFPCWDISGGLVAVNKRSVSGKKYLLQGHANKEIYLLNFIREDNFNNINYPYIAVCESQINALYAWSLGIPAVALLGTGSQYQYNLLNTSGITNFVLCFDGDDAGRKGAERFKKNISKDTFITDILLPTGKDLNDLTPEEVNTLFNANEVYWRISS